MNNNINNETYVIEKIKEHDQRLISHDEKINELDKNQIESSALLKAQFSVQKSLTDSVEKFTGTTNDLKIVMINIQNTLKSNNLEVANNKKEVQDLRQELKNTLLELNKKIEEEKEKSTIDLRDVSKTQTYNKLLKVGGIIGVAGILISFAAAFVKFMQMAQQFESVLKVIK